MLRTTLSPLRSPSRTCHGMRTAWLLIVIPRSRSMSIRSRYWSRICRASTTPVSCSIRSASVDLPWSLCAMMRKLRMRPGSVAPGSRVGCALFRSLPMGRLVACGSVGCLWVCCLPVVLRLRVVRWRPAGRLPPHDHYLSSHVRHRAEELPPGADRSSGLRSSLIPAPKTRRLGNIAHMRRVWLPTVPYEETAQRPEWTDLPAAVRAAVEAHLGAPVTTVRLARGGFPRGFAAVLTPASGEPVFVKASSDDYL